MVQLIPGQTTHGKRYDRVYKIYQGMKRRCYQSSERSYVYYGARGIKVCKAWETFEGFYNDMGDCPKGYSLERIDPNGNYEPSNCKWIPLEEQGNNKRSSIKFTYKGETLCITEWAKKFNINSCTLRHRIKKGWDIELALLTPSKRRGRQSSKTKFYTSIQVPIDKNDLLLFKQQCHKNNSNIGDTVADFIRTRLTTPQKVTPTHQPQA